jgi:DNA-binding LacI/PurR family transcriptional regulator
MKRTAFRDGTKIRQAHDGIKALAYSRGPNAKLPTARELCTEFDMNWDALSEALRELEDNNIIYRRQGSGIYVSSKLYHKSIAVVLGSTYFHTAGVSPFWNNLWRLFVQEAEQRSTTHSEEFGFHLTRYTEGAGDSIQSALREEIEAGRVDGVLAVGLSWMDAHWLKTRPTPVVSFAGAHNGWLVSQDGLEARRMSVEALMSQGCQRIANWWPASLLPSNAGNPDQMPNYMESRIAEEVETAMVRAGAPIHPELNRAGRDVDVEDDGVPAGTHQEEGYLTAREVFGRPRSLWPDGIVITDDMMTFGAMIACNEMHVEVGKDVKIATHANVDSPILSLFEKRLTLVEFDPNDIVKAMFGLLDRLLANEAPEKEMITVKPRLRQPT